GLHKRSPGQSIVIIGLILAILIGLVALSVDVGNTYAEQRAAQRASDAAALDGMTAFLNGEDCQAIYQRITDSLESHNISWVASDSTAPLQPGERKLDASFVLGDNDGTPSSIAACASSSGYAPGNARYVRVALDGVQSTNFATLFG